MVTVSYKHTAPDAYDTFTGCSAATPLAAGIAALLLSVDPSLTPHELEELIKRGAEDQLGGADDLPGWDRSYGWGRVNARRSLDLLIANGGPGTAVRFLRGDSNSDAGLDISDPVFLLNYLFLGGPPALCDDAVDTNDDGTIDIADGVFLLSFLFLSGSLPEPHPACGLDYSLDSLGCAKGCP
jgi:hypothetical protein